jgi:hypothetical protein
MRRFVDFRLPFFFAFAISTLPVIARAEQNAQLPLALRVVFRRPWASAASVVFGLFALQLREALALQLREALALVLFFSL